MRARQDDLDARADLLDLEDHRANALADVVGLAADLFGARQDALDVAAEVHDHRVAFEALDRAALDLAELLLEFVVDHVAFRLADAGHDRLLDRHREDAALFLHRHVVVAVDLAAVAVDHELDVVHAILACQRLSHRLLDPLHEGFLVDLLVTGDRVDVAEDVG